MSFLTATNTELIYNMPTAGADITAVGPTIATANSTSNPAAFLPPLYSIWQPSTVVGKGFHVRLGLVLDASAATFTFKYGLNTTQATTTFPIGLAASAGVTVPTSTTVNGDVELDITVAQVGESSGTPAALCYVTGHMRLGIGASSTAGSVWDIGSASTTPTTISVNPVTSYYWEATFTFGATVAHSSVQQHQIFGLN